VLTKQNMYDYAALPQKRDDPVYKFRIVSILKVNYKQNQVRISINIRTSLLYSDCNFSIQFYKLCS